MSEFWAPPHLAELKQFLAVYGIPLSEVCVIQGTALSRVMPGRVPNDLDLCINPAFFPLLDAGAAVRNAKAQHGKIVSWLTFNKIDVYLEYYNIHLGVSDYEIVTSADLHIVQDGLKYVKPELVFLLKTMRRSRKDLRDVALCLEYAAAQSASWSWSLIANVTRRNSLPLEERKVEIKPVIDGKISPGQLLAFQHKNGAFRALDVIVRYMFIEDYLRGCDDGERLYQKMLQLRNKPRDPEDFKKLIHSMQDCGYDHSQPIEIDSYGLITGGAHRLACAMYLDLPEVSVKQTCEECSRDYSAPWFTANLSRAEMDAIVKKQEQLFQQAGVYFTAVLWPPATPYFEKILADISDYGHVISCTRYQCNDQSLAEFCLAVYDVDGGTAYKILRKNHNMKQGMNTLCFVQIYVENPRWKRNAKGALLCENMEELKRSVREKYKSSINNYIHDIIIHISDSPDLSRATNDLITVFSNDGRLMKLESVDDKYKKNRFNLFSKIGQVFNQCAGIKSLRK